MNESEQPLFESGLGAQALIDSMESHVAVLDHDGVIVMVNRAWRRFAQENGANHPDDYVGVNYLETAREAAHGINEAADVYRAMQRMLSGRLDRYQITYPCHSPQEQRWFRAKFARLDAEQTKIIVTHENVTAWREAQELSDAKSRFISAVSHELKTPLAPLLAFNDMLLRDKHGTLSERDAGYLRVMQRNGRRLEMLIHDLLDMSELERGNFKLSMSEFDPLELIHELEESFRPVLQQKGQKARVRVEADRLWIRADRDRLSQVVSNLLSNASKFSPEGATVDVSAFADGDELSVNVRDRGAGISEEQQAHLFEPFYRADNEETRAASGTGTGLYISQCIVEQHGGEISLLSHREKGTMVEFRVPGLLPVPKRGHAQEPARQEAIAPRSRLDEPPDAPERPRSGREWLSLNL
ncbi:MAG: ATP-binding protein [Chloroflexota bacterium]